MVCVRVFYELVLVFTASVTCSGVDKTDDSKVAEKQHNDKAYAAGEKYFSRLGDYDRDSWIDPYSMFDYDTKAFKEDETRDAAEKNTPEPSGSGKIAAEVGNFSSDAASAAITDSAFCDKRELESRKCEQNEYIYISRWLKKFLRKLNYSPDLNMNEIQIVRFPVVNNELQEIAKFFDSKNLRDVQDLENVFDAIASQIQISHPDSRSIYDVFHWVWDNSAIVLTLLICVVSMRYLHVLFHRQLLLRSVIILACVTSVIWTWIHLYQKEIAKQQATLHSSGYPEECQPVSFSYTSILKHIWRTTFALEDTCAKYYEAQLVDPFWKISPLVVVSETVSNFVLQPVGSIASHLNLFLKNLYSEMSYFMMIPATFFAFIMLLMLGRYRLRLPFHIVTLEPAIQSNRENRVEFLPFQNSDGNETAGDAIQSSVHGSSSPPPACNDFIAAGDHLHVTSSYKVGHEQIEQMPLEEPEHATDVLLKDQSTQTNELCKEVEDTEICCSGNTDVLQQSTCAFVRSTQ